MLHIGIVGAENSHCAAIARLLNIEKKLPARVVAVWGETLKFAKAAAETAQIPRIVRDWRDMLGQVDGVMIDHRHAKYHAEVATFYVQNRVPCFVDKPFTFSLAEARRLCALARKKRVPITSFSTIPLQTSFLAFKKALRKIGTVVSLTSTGPVDLNSKYGGVFFYGVHQIDAIVDLLGTDVQDVCVRKHGAGGVAVLTYRDGPVVTMNCINNENRTFHWSAVGDKQILDWPYSGDASPYLAGARIFIRMFRTGREPYDRRRLLVPVAVLEAMAKSIKLGGKVVKVPRIRI